METQKDCTLDLPKSAEKNAGARGNHSAFPLSRPVAPVMGGCSPAASILLPCACYPRCAKFSVLWPRVRSCRPENRQGRAVQADGRGGQIGRAGVLTAFWKLQTLYQRSGQLDRALALTQDLGQQWRGEILVEYRLKAEQGSLQVVLGKFEESRMLMREAVGEL